MVRLERSRQNKNLLYWHDKLNGPTKEGPLSFVLFESPFTSISTVSSLSRTYKASKGGMEGGGEGLEV
jgi:hypothetical protein